MRVLICNNFARLGSGINASVRMEENALRGLGHHVRIFARDNAQLDEVRGAAKARLLSSCLYSLPAKRSLLQLLSTDRYDIAHVHNTVPLLTGSIYDAFRKHRVITIQHLHNYRAFCLSSYAYRNDKRCDSCVRTAFTACTLFRCYRDSLVASGSLTAARLIDCARGRWSGDGAHAYIANSAFTKKEHVRHGIADGRIWVLHNPSEDVAALLEASATVPTARRKKITFVGSLLREKGVYAALDLAEVMPDWEIQFVGAGHEEASVRQQIAARGLANIRLAGLLAGVDKARAWHDSFVTIVPSLWDEPFGLVVPESYSLSIPVVSTGSGGMAETIRDGKTGFIQSFRNPPETAALLRALWEDAARYAEMRLAARRLYDAEFTEQVFAERLGLLQATILDRYRSHIEP
jgi:glycosyltransferase involved in cell wall biosynthesis